MTTAAPPQFHGACAEIAFANAQVYGVACSISPSRELLLSALQDCAENGVDMYDYGGDALVLKFWGRSSTRDWHKPASQTAAAESRLSYDGRLGPKTESKQLLRLLCHREGASAVGVQRLVVVDARNEGRSGTPLRALYATWICDNAAEYYALHGYTSGMPCRHANDRNTHVERSEVLSVTVPGIHA